MAGLAREGTNWVKQNFSEVFTQGTSFGVDEAGRLYVASKSAGVIDRIEDSGMARPPVISPAGGISPSHVATLTSLNPGARIRFTFDGRDPAQGDPEVDSGYTVSLTNGLTIKAQALRTDLQPSEVSVAMFTGFKVASPVFTPSVWPIRNPTYISITSATPDAIIRYTTNGPAPSTNSPIYTAAVGISSNVTLIAQACRAGFQDSDIVRVDYVLGSAAAPTFDPPYGAITNGTRITISAYTSDSVVRYTTNGTDPTTTSPLYTAPVKINGNTVLKARAFAQGYHPSSITAVHFPLVRVALVEFRPGPGAVSYGTAIELNCPTPETTIHFTTDGSDPSTSAPVYLNPITIHQDTLVRARAYKSDFDPSEWITSGNYLLPKAARPAFEPAEGALTATGAWIRISSATPSATIRYTTNGTEPTLESSLYVGPFFVQAPIKIAAYAWAPEHNRSDGNTICFGLVLQRRAIVQTVAGRPEPGRSDGVFGQARFNSPQAVCAGQNGTLYVADTGNNLIRAISRDGVVATIAGSGAQISVNGTGTNASFALPAGIAIDPAGNLYVSEFGSHKLRKVDPSRVVTTMALFRPPHCSPSAAHVDRAPDGYIYVAGWEQLEKVSPSATYIDDPYNYGMLPSSCMSGLRGVAIEPLGRVFATGASHVFAIESQGQRVLAGSVRGFNDGPWLQARFDLPKGIAVGSDGALYVADGTRIRVVNTNGNVSTLAGSHIAGYRNGPGADAQFKSASGISLDGYSNIYVADAGNHAIRKISFDRDQDTIPDPDDAGVGIDDRLTDSDADGQNNAAEFWAGTNPTHATSFLRLDARVNTTNAVVLSWPTAAGRSYTLTHSTNLTQWADLLPIFAGDGTPKAMTNSSALPRSFFRLRVEP